MRELTIEEKAKRYDESIKRAKKKQEQSNGMILKKWLWDVFPELKDKEDEDEKIRKALIEYFNEQCDMSDWNGIYGYQVVSWLKRQGKEKFVNNVKPKFHEGDWVVFITSESVYQIEKIENYEYTLRHILGGSMRLSFSNEKLIRNWTINDAKDGDVLAVENMIFVYKIVLASHIVSYCKLFNNKFEHFSDGRTCCEGNSKVRPATKEQRDLLFAKMKESGYEWDAEKKELKKIENKPLVIDEGKDEIDRNFTEMMLKDHTKQKPVPNWRSIDAEYMNKLCEIIDEYNVETTTKCCWKNWLKSLKERVQSQPKQEWSEEDKERIQRIYTFLWKNRKGDTDTIYQIENDAEWLKNLSAKFK